MENKKTSDLIFQNIYVYLCLYIIQSELIIINLYLD